ncbi:MAG: hypothetical protein ACRDRK_11555 [Pseudonocardia sp.]
MPPYSYVISHIHTDGPIPGPHSLLTISSAAYSDCSEHGSLISTFTTNVRELPGATLHPIDLQIWRDRAEDWLTTRRASRPPALATTAFARWIDHLPGRATFVADTAEPDYLFLYWYLQRFAGHWPFARTSTEADLIDRLPRTPPCPLASCRTPLRRTS